MKTGNSTTVFADRKRSKQVTAVSLAGFAAAFMASCGGDDTSIARCVDGSNKVVDVSNCDNESRKPFVVGKTSKYFWNFDGSGGKKIGETATGGTNVNPADQASISARGGFGSGEPTTGTGTRNVAGSGGGGDDGDGKSKGS